MHQERSYNSTRRYRRYLRTSCMCKRTGDMARYEKLARRRCRLWAPIRSGTGIPEPLSAINNRSTSREKERERSNAKLSPFPVERRMGGGVFMDESKIHAYRQSRSNNFGSRIRRKREAARIQMDDIYGEWLRTWLKLLVICATWARRMVTYLFYRIQNVMVLSERFVRGDRVR